MRAAGTRSASRTRVRDALAHREPDRIPLDLGGSRMTGIHARAYPGLRSALGLPPVAPRIIDIVQQLPHVDGDVMDALGCDVRFVGPRAPAGGAPEVTAEGPDLVLRDEWRLVRRMPRDGGLYFDIEGVPPLPGEVGDAAIEAFPWPDAGDPARYAGMADEARRIAEEEGRAVLVGSICAGLTETLFRLRGFEDGYMDLAAEPARARRVMEHVLDIKLGYWERALASLGELVDVVCEADDLGSQERTLFSPATYRSLVKPLQRELFAFIRARTDAPILFHTCGAVRELIPDLIEIGVDALNPVQVSAAGMDGGGLKREFGRHLSFWGGGVDTQRVLGDASPDEVRADVRRRIRDLRGGGGFVFATVHNVQPNVPPANLVAMWEAWREEAGDG